MSALDGGPGPVGAPDPADLPDPPDLPDTAVPDDADGSGRPEVPQELLSAVRAVRRSSGHPALAAALEWEEAVWSVPLEVLLDRHDVREEDVRLLVLPVAAVRAHGLDPRRVSAFTAPAVSDRAVVACWAAGLEDDEIDAVAASGAAVDEAGLLVLAALRRRR